MAGPLGQAGEGLGQDQRSPMAVTSLASTARSKGVTPASAPAASTKSACRPSAAGCR